MKNIFTALLIAGISWTNAQVIIGDAVGTAPVKTSVLLEFAKENKGIVLPYVRTLPAATTGGTLVLDASIPTAARVRYSNGTSWVDLSGQDANITTALVDQPIVASEVPAKAIIGADTSAADGVLVLESTTKAMVLPTVADVQAIPSPAPGMMVYVNKANAKRLAVYNGSKWSFWSPAVADKIRTALNAGGCASCVAYDAAAADSWVKITAAEYTALANASNVTGATTVGADAATFSAAGVTGGTFGAPYSHSSTSAPIPASSYIYAYRFKASNFVSNGANCVGGKVKYGTTVNTGFVQYGSVIPTYNCTPLTTHYWVCKQPTTATPASTCYLGALNTSSGGNGDPAISGNTGYYGAGDVSTLPTTGFGVQMQALSTTSKQW